MTDAKFAADLTGVHLFARTGSDITHLIIVD